MATIATSRRPKRYSGRRAGGSGGTGAASSQFLRPPGILDLANASAPGGPGGAAGGGSGTTALPGGGTAAPFVAPPVDPAGSGTPAYDTNSAVHAVRQKDGSVLWQNAQGHIVASTDVNGNISLRPGFALNPANLQLIGASGGKATPPGAPAPAEGPGGPGAGAPGAPGAARPAGAGGPAAAATPAPAKSGAPAPYDPYEPADAKLYDRNGSAAAPAAPAPAAPPQQANRDLNGGGAGGAGIDWNRVLPSMGPDQLGVILPHIAPQSAPISTYDPYEPVDQQNYREPAAAAPAPSEPASPPGVPAEFFQQPAGRAEKDLNVGGGTTGDTSSTGAAWDSGPAAPAPSAPQGGGGGAPDWESYYKSFFEDPYR